MNKLLADCRAILHFREAGNSEVATYTAVKTDTKSSVLHLGMLPDLVADVQPTVAKCCRQIKAGIYLQVCVYMMCLFDYCFIM